MKADWEANLTGTTRRAFTTGLAAAGAAPMAGLARAQPGYPAGLTIKFVVGFPAGGAQDIVGRVDRRPAGCAMEGADRRRERRRGRRQSRHGPRRQGAGRRHADPASSRPDLATNQFLYARLPFDPEKDIVPLALVASLPNLLCVRKDLPVNSVAELIAYAKANPGKLNYALLGHRHDGASLRRALQAHGRRRHGGRDTIAAARRRSTTSSARTSI